MKSKFLKFMIHVGVFWAPVIAHSAQRQGIWSDSPVGRCFNSVQEFLVEKYGSDYASDENIKSVALGKAKEASHDSIFLWVMDLTPGVNITRTLVMEKGGRACAILYAPLSSDISLQNLPRGGLPKMIVTNDSPPPGFSRTRIYYKLNKNNNTYLPQSCYQVGPSRQKTKIPCSQAFAE
jgi:hypothetical protein